MNMQRREHERDVAMRRVMLYDPDIARLSLPTGTSVSSLETICRDTVQYMLSRCV